ncbi:MAG: hypothetical protein KDE51_03165, partial [Anaerolineales bacterium]|nr:hypothetical protein [Anaerolineales bacterium]
WYQKSGDLWCIIIPMGWTAEQFGEGLTETQAWSLFMKKFPLIASHLLPYQNAGRKRTDQGDFWWELRACSYYDAFDQPKIIWNDITKLPRFSWDESGLFINQKGYIIPSAPPFLLAILQSRVNWFNISQICTPLRLRAGLWQYQVLAQFVERLPIPTTTESQKDSLGKIALTITRLANSRYQLHQQMRHRIQSDLGTEHKSLNTKLVNWWELDFSDFRTEIKKIFRQDIPLNERDEWEKYLAAQIFKHSELTQQIIALEIELNDIVYKLHDLTPEEIAIIEESTKYAYGEV